MIKYRLPTWEEAMEMYKAFPQKVMWDPGLCRFVIKNDDGSFTSIYHPDEMAARLRRVEKANLNA